MKRLKLISSVIFFCLLTGQLWAESGKGKAINIVFIGNSITQGAGLADPQNEAPPAKAAAYLGRQPGVASVGFANCGVSGCTTVDYLPRTATLFNRMQEAAERFEADTQAMLVFSVMLGTNDSAVKGTNGCPVSPDQYQLNMRKIIDELLAGYPACKVVVNRPIWYSPNTYNGAVYMQEGLSRVEAYYPELEKLVAYYEKQAPQRVYMGDTAGFDYFRQHSKDEFQAEQGNAGVFFLHPNAKGAVSLGELWGKAIYKVVFETAVMDAVERQMSMYPKSTLKDLYKNFFQDKFGPGHIISDTAAAGKYLRSELASYTDVSGEIAETTGWEGNFYRVNLSVIKDGSVPYDAFMDAFVRSVNGIRPVAVEKWAEEWNRIEMVIRGMNLLLPDYEADRAEITNRLAGGDYVGHHSKQFEDAYSPHYRIVGKQIFENELLPLLRAGNK